MLALPPTAASASVLRSLRSEGVSVSAVTDGIGVLDAVRSGDPALLVLDVELPGPDQSAVLAAVQSEAPNVPVIAVTPRERRSALLGMLRGDRDDYLLRPFAVDELAARIRLRLRLGPPAESSLLRQGELTVDTEFGEVVVDGAPVSLSPTEYALLLALMGAPGEVVAPSKLAREVWSEPASANLVQVYISYLRRKIGPDRIRTVRGEGYILES
ncbi:response regulator transcription factor [Pseudonocardia sp. TRM90224]|uniref:response regulator transcription factor n=1 Tax=Pseudonocardia sp. TRM90224 TaxID=2812678 RepID=UPI001E5C78C1|nr:response regulator transcription factor [Pseudonocardia sp. TRM90224]